MTSNMVEFLILNKRYENETVNELITKNILITNDEITADGYPLLPTIISENSSAYIWLFKRLRQTFPLWINSPENYSTIFAEKVNDCILDYGEDKLEKILLCTTSDLEEYRINYINDSIKQHAEERIDASIVGLFDNEYEDELEEDIKWLENIQLLSKNGKKPQELPTFEFIFMDEKFTFTDMDINIYQDKEDRVTDILMERVSDKTLWRAVFKNSEFQYMMKDFLNMLADGDLSDTSGKSDKQSRKTEEKSPKKTKPLELDYEEEENGMEYLFEDTDDLDEIFGDDFFDPTIDFGDDK